MKIWLWFLGAAALLNVGADIWFRTSIATSTHAPWYVWTPAIATVAVGIVTLIAQAVISRRQTGEALPAQVFEQVAVEWTSAVRLLPRDVAVEIATAKLRAAGMMSGLSADGWESDYDPDHVPTVVGELWRHRILFRRSTPVVGDES